MVIIFQRIKCLIVRENIYLEHLLKRREIGDLVPKNKDSTIITLLNKDWSFIFPRVEG